MSMGGVPAPGPGKPDLEPMFPPRSLRGTLSTKTSDLFPPSSCFQENQELLGKERPKGSRMSPSCLVDMRVDDIILGMTLQDF